MSNPDFNLRAALIRERQELDTRIRVLGQFLYSGGKELESISEHSRRLMRNRLEAMHDYRNSLTSHIQYEEMQEPIRTVNVEIGKLKSAMAGLAYITEDAEQFAKRHNLNVDAVFDLLRAGRPSTGEANASS